MEINAHKSMGKLVSVLSKAVASDPLAERALSDCTLTLGPASDARYQIPLDAMYNASFVGDSAAIGDIVTTAELDALSKSNPDSVGMRPVWNNATKKYDFHCAKQSTIGDSLMSNQTLSAWNVSWFKEIFKQPLAWSKAKRFVTIEAGTDPWAEVMSYQLSTYSGFSALNSAGSPANSLSRDIEVQSGMMSSTIINMDVTYKLAIEEMKRSQTSQSPLAGKMLSQKQEYANWVLEMLTDMLIYQGNAPTGTVGLFTVNGATAWSGDSLTTILAGSSAQKGSDMYLALGKVVADFLTTNMNKFPRITIGMSPFAYNALSRTPYSSVYNPNSALKIFLDNFLAGEGFDGNIPTIDIFPDPLLAANSSINANAYDYLVITAPSIGTGPNNEQQPLVSFGMPLEKFVYPVVPGQYLTQYKMLRRAAGIFAPYAPAIKVYTGFGVS